MTTTDTTTKTRPGRDPFAAIADRLPSRYAPGDTDVPYYFPVDSIWHPVIYYPAGVVVQGEGPIWLVEPYPAARADRTDGLDPVDGAGVAVLTGDGAPRPRTDDADGDWVVPGRALIESCAYDVYVDNPRDLLAAWCEAWAIAAALNSNTLNGLGVLPDDIEVLLAAERRELIGDSRFAGRFSEMTWTPIGAADGERQVKPLQVKRLRDGANPLITACTVAERNPERELSGGRAWLETTYQLTRTGVNALQAIRAAGAQLGGPRCEVCGCTEERACPGRCSWLRPGPDQGPRCSACPR